MKKRFLILMAMLLGACAHWPSSGVCTDVGGAGYCLQATTGLQAFSVVQSVEVHYPNGLERLIVQVEVDSEGQRMAVLTPFGQRLLQLTYDNVTLTTDAPDSVKSKLDPVQLAALVQFSLWPLERIQAGFAEGDVRVEALPFDGRRVLRHDQEVMRVERNAEDDRHAVVRSGPLSFVIDTLESMAP